LRFCCHFHVTHLSAQHCSPAQAACECHCLLPAVCLTYGSSSLQLVLRPPLTCDHASWWRPTAGCFAVWRLCHCLAAADLLCLHVCHPDAELVQECWQGTHTQRLIRLVQPGARHVSHLLLLLHCKEGWVQHDLLLGCASGAAPSLMGLGCPVPSVVHSHAALHARGRCPLHVMTAVVGVV
jgi:hypothetical protein